MFIGSLFIFYLAWDMIRRSYTKFFERITKDRSEEDDMEWKEPNGK